MLLFKAFDQFPDLIDLLRVKTNGRLIQNDHLRISQHCLGNSYSLSVSFGKILDQTMFHVRYFNHIHNFFDHGRLLCSWNFFKISDKLQVLKNSHVKVKRWLLRKIANTFFCFLRLLQNIMSINNNASFCGSNIAGDHIHGSRFTGSIWS